MSTKSKNTTSSGPSKFRKDAEIFSPSNYIHPAEIANVQPYIPVNPSPIPMMMNPPVDFNYMYGYNPYMYPTYEPNPYNQVQFMPQAYPYAPMNSLYNQPPHMMPQPNPGMVRNGAKYSKNQRNGSASSSTPSSVQKSDASTKSTDDTTIQSEQEEVTPSPEVESNDELTLKIPAEEVEPETKPVEVSSDSEILKKLPLYINSSFEDFFKDDEFLNKRKQSYQDKDLQEKDVIINKQKDEVISFNLSNGNGSPGKINWASIVTNSVKKTKPKAPIHKETPSEVVQAVTPEPISNVDVLDSVGLLSLKVMFKQLKDSEYFEIHQRGLTNSGNICYMNSILQVLIYCEPFNQLFKLIDSKTIGSLNSKTPLIDAVISIFKDFNTASSKSLSPESFYMKLINHGKFQHLKWGQQEDAEEFLGYLLDGLHEEFIKAIADINPDHLNALIATVEDNETKLQIKSAIKTIKKLNGNADDSGLTTDNDDDDGNDGWNEVNNNKVSTKRTVEIEPSPIKTLFGGQFRSVLQVPNKKDQSVTLDPFQCIQLDIKDEKINTIEEAFKHLNEPEQIPFKLNDNKEVLAKKQTFIDSLPNILVIHLKRFSFESSGGNGNLVIEKLRKKIQYSHKLSVPLELFSNWRKNTNKDYKLIGVVYHHGVGAEGGHYTSDVLKQTSVSNANEWIRIDDTLINKISKDDVLNNDDDIKNAYILFYQRM